MWKLRPDHYLVVAAICGLLLLPTLAKETKLTPKSPELVDIAPIPVADQTFLAMSEFAATLSARSILVIDIPSAAVLVSKNSDQQVAPASTTKMLTALVARDLYAMDEVVTIREAAFSVGQTIGFQVNEQFTVQNLLAGLLISSGNDAALALANHHPAGYQGFIDAMNQKARKLRLSHSAFRNPSGLDDTDHLSTAHDLAVVARALMADPELRQLVATRKMQIADVTGQHSHWLYNTNVLLHEDETVVGIKTGTTELAKENVVTQINRNGRRLLLVVLGSEDRYGDTKHLVNWVEQHYQWIETDTSTLQLVKEP